MTIIRPGSKTSIDHFAPASAHQVITQQFHCGGITLIDTAGPVENHYAARQQIQQAIQPVFNMSLGLGNFDSLSALVIQFLLERDDVILKFVIGLGELVGNFGEALECVRQVPVLFAISLVVTALGDILVLLDTVVLDQFRRILLPYRIKTQLGCWKRFLR